MNDDASSLRAAWMADPPTAERDPRSVVRDLIQKDRAERLRERRLRLGGMAALSALIPVLIWAAAHGVAPVVRGAYALMSAGCAAGLAAEWLYLDWSRRALPGPDDTRSQLQTTAFMLGRQEWLAKTAPLWTLPVFVGVALIGVWVYSERTLAAAATLWALDLVAWIGSGIVAWHAAAGTSRRKLTVEDALADLK